MDTKQIIKYVAIAAAAYLAYEYFLKPSIFPKQLPAGPDPAPGPQATPHPTTGAPTGTPASPPPTGTATGAPPVVTEANLILWATDSVAAAKAPSNVVYTADQWNYYRQKGGHTVVDALAFSGVNSANRGSYTMNAQTYWQGMTAAGMSGLYSGAAGLGAYSWLA